MVGTKIIYNLIYEVMTALDDVWLGSYGWLPSMIDCGSNFHYRFLSMEKVGIQKNPSLPEWIK